MHIIYAYWLFQFVQMECTSSEWPKHMKLYPLADVGKFSESIQTIYRAFIVYSDIWSIKLHIYRCCKLESLIYQHRYYNLSVGNMNTICIIKWGIFCRSPCLILLHWEQIIWNIVLLIHCYMDIWSNILVHFILFF